MLGAIKEMIKRAGGKKNRPYCTAVIAAAGSSVRMDGENKMFMQICEVPVLAHTLMAFERCPAVNEIIVVTRQEDIVEVGELCRSFGIGKATKVIRGGDTRALSVFEGIAETPPHTGLIAIHDGARPLVTSKIILEAVECAAEFGAAAPAVPVKDTVKSAAGGVVVRTVERASLFAVQTPQVFEASIIKGALQKAIEENAEITDDCQAAERIGVKVHLTEGSYENIKITTPGDIWAAEAIMARREEL